jgi:isopentenyl phosphate kinase
MSSNRSPTVVKLGGSLITNKDKPATFYWERAERLAKEISQYREPLVLLHGTGSFGKPPAILHRYLDGFVPRTKAWIVAEVSALLHELRSHMLNTLVRAGVPAFNVSAASIFETRNGEIVTCHSSALFALLNRNLVPIISGDFVVDSCKDFAACSSDAMASKLAVQLTASRLLFATDTPGVMDYASFEANLIEDMKPNDARLGSINPLSDDVSGGMHAKLRAGFDAADSGVETLILDGRVPDRLISALLGERVIGTRLLGSCKEDSET